jgi:hypothetical protein
VTARGARVLAALAAVLALAASGCASLPTHSPAVALRKLPRDGRVADPPEIQFDSAPPAVGATQAEIAAGFFAAQEAWQLGHARAREFLVPDTTWRDDLQVLVTEKAPTVGVPDGAHRVPVTVRPVAQLNADASYTPLAGSARVTWKLLMRRVNGQWRIVALPPGVGVVISRAGFERVYREYSLYFLDHSQQWLVPDVRYLPYDPAALPSELTQALLAGPSDWLAPVVSDLLAPPVTLANLVLGSDRLVRVDVSGLNGLGRRPRRLAVAQLAWTLSQLGVIGVRVSSDGKAVDLPETQDDRPVLDSDFSDLDPDTVPAHVPAYYLRDGALVTLDGRQPAGPAGTGQYGLDSVAVSSDRREVAGISVGGSGQLLYAGPIDRPLRAVLSARTLTRPTWDRAATTFWTVLDGHALVRFGPTGRAATVRRELGGRGKPAAVPARPGTVGALQLSRDGTRVALTLGPPGRQRLYLGVVGTDQAGQPAVSGLRLISGTLTDVRDLAWESAEVLAVLGRSGRGPLSAWRVPADGSDDLELLTNLPGRPLSISAGYLQPPLVSVADGTIWQHGSDWTSAARGSAPAYPG